MDLKSYFDSTSGLGVLSTSDSHGYVDSAIYSRPHVFNDETVAFIMRDRLSHKNLQSNPHAAYLFKEEGKGYSGMRLFLTKVKEEQDSELLYQLRRRQYDNAADEIDPKYLVYFNVDKELPLVGSGGDD